MTIIPDDTMIIWYNDNHIRHHHDNHSNHHDHSLDGSWGTLIQFGPRLDTRWSSHALSDRSGPRRSGLFSYFHFSYFQPHNHKCILLIKLCVFKCSVVPLAICDVDSLFSHCADFQSTAKNNYRQSRFKNRQISTNKQEPEATKYLIFLFLSKYFLWGWTPKNQQKYAIWQQVDFKSKTLLLTIPDICPFFSTDQIFGPNFLHAKVHKSRQNRFRD